MIYREYMATSHEEADNILVQQILMVAKEKVMGMPAVLSDENDLGVLLLHYYLEQSLPSLVIMENPVKERSVIDVCATAEQHRNIVQGLLAAHALSVCVIQ